MSAEIRSCEDALRLLAQHLDGELQQETSEAVAEHLSKCRSCYSRAEFERRLKDQLGRLGEEPVRPEFADRLSGLIRQFAVEDDR